MMASTQAQVVTQSSIDFSRARRSIRRQVLLVRLAISDAAPLRRGIDIAAGLAGIVFLSPILLIAALAVKLTSKGPVLFWQERVGEMGRRFMMPKFRTMCVDAEARKAAVAAAAGDQVMDTLRFKMKQDPRMTSVGGLFRKLSIDELPQLAHLITGKMTLVGPRPAIPRETNLYDPRATRRLEVKPGLTCLWQVGGRSDLSFAEQVRLDIEYIDTVDFLGELRILVATPLAVVSGRGAY